MKKIISKIMLAIVSCSLVVTLSISIIGVIRTSILVRTKVENEITLATENKSMELSSNFREIEVTESTKGAMGVYLAFNPDLLGVKQ